jgi:thymidylate synthase (FAD)
MKIELLNYTPLWVSSTAIRKCWASEDKSDTYQTDAGDIIIGEKDRDLIDRIGNKNKHSSTLEHLYYNFDIKDVSRGLLQELSRHRIASYTVKSTRYTLKELKSEEAFLNYVSVTDGDYEENNDGFERSKKYIVHTGVKLVDLASILALDNLRDVLLSGVPNDKAKYCLPESYKTSLVMSINARSFQNFLSLRTAKDALWEIRDLANAMFDKIPQEHKYLFEDCVKILDKEE